jgi:cytochrome b561
MNDWGWPARLFHWLGALAILALLAHGWWMTHVVPRPERLPNYAWHAAIGYDLIVLMALRLLWRWFSGVPDLPQDAKRWEQLAAHAGHVLLYVLTFVTALVGWAMAGTMRTPLNQDLFGIAFPLLYDNKDAHRFLEHSHRYLAYTMAALVAVHIAGALRHHFIKRNNVLHRMITSSPAIAEEVAVRSTEATAAQRGGR